MRVAHRLAILIAVLSAVLVQSVGAHANSSLSLRAGTHRLDTKANSLHQRSWLREMQAVVRREAEETETGAVDCCPTVLEMVEPQGGKNQDGMFLELYMEGQIKQRFYELSCRKDVENKPCRFVDRKLYNQSRCVQKFSYSYAIAKNPHWEGDSDERHRHHRDMRILPQLPSPNGRWMLAYIRVRSGCACELRPKNKKQHSSHVRHERRKHEVDMMAFESLPDT